MDVGGGPLIILKNSGKIYSASSNPIHMFGVDFFSPKETQQAGRVGIVTAQTQEQFDQALADLREQGDWTALNPGQLSE